MRRILPFFISIYLSGVAISMAQDSTAVIVDSVKVKDQKYGLRVGVDLSKPIRTLLEDGYSGFEVSADFRFSHRFYAAVELGSEKKDRFEDNLNSKASGSYIKVGVDFNAYNNWVGLNNSIFVGLRYGVSSFSQELISYSIYTTNQTFSETELREVNLEFGGLTASWAELIVGIKTELLPNLFLGLQLQLKRRISDTKPDNFDNLYIPGFNRTYDESNVGVGYGYSLSYLIPLFKK